MIVALGAFALHIVESLVRRAIESQQFRDAAIQTVRAAHAEYRRVMDGRDRQRTEHIRE